MTKLQTSLIALCGILLVGLYLLPNIPKANQGIGEKRALEASTINASKIVAKAKTQINPEQHSKIDELDAVFQAAKEPTQQIEALKRISSTWNSWKQYPAGAVYAERVAVEAPSDSAWSIAGSTYFSGFQMGQDTAIKNYCWSKAIESFENAVSLSPQNTSHRINLALCYVESASEPMKGIMMLRDLSEKYPEDSKVFYTLGRLSLRTGQMEKAVERLTRAVTLEPDHLNARYLLAQTYAEMGDKEKAKLNFQACLEIAKDPNVKKEIENILTNF